MRLDWPDALANGGACTGNDVELDDVPPSWYDASAVDAEFDGGDGALFKLWFMPYVDVGNRSSFV